MTIDWYLWENTYTYFVRVFDGEYKWKQYNIVINNTHNVDSNKKLYWLNKKYANALNVFNNTSVLAIRHDPGVSVLYEW